MNAFFPVLLVIVLLLLYLAWAWVLVRARPVIVVRYRDVYRNPQPYRSHVRRPMIPTVYTQIYDPHDDNRPGTGTGTGLGQVPLTPEARFINDEQNVHDSAIQNAIVQRYENLEKDAEEGYVQRMIQYFDDSEITKVIRRMCRFKVPLSRFNKTQIEILGDTFESGDDNVRGHLRRVLSDMTRPWKKGDKGFDGFRCPTGNVTRILEAAFINDPQNMPRTKAMLQQEMLMRASVLSREHASFDRVRSDLVKEYSGAATEADLHDIINEWGM